MTAVAFSALALLTGAAVGWPVAPADVQHPIRGSFLDPRPDGFHIGVWVDPLRAGGRLAPRADTQRPRIDSVRFFTRPGPSLLARDVFRADSVLTNADLPSRRPRIPFAVHYAPGTRQVRDGRYRLVVRAWDAAGNAAARAVTVAIRNQ